MNKRYLLILPAIAMSGVVVAQDGPYQCSHGDSQRRVEVIYETGGAMPCEVRYHKDTEAPGEHQVLWRAATEAGYCEARASEFITKLEGWGWSCGAGAVTAEPAATEADDTDALAPAEEEASESE